MRTKKNYLCVYTLFFMCLFSCGGSKNTLLELPKDIQTKYEYFIREGETISFKYPFMSVLHTLNSSLVKYLVASAYVRLLSFAYFTRI